MPLQSRGCGMTIIQFRSVLPRLANVCAHVVGHFRYLDTAHQGDRQQCVIVISVSSKPRRKTRTHGRPLMPMTVMTAHLARHLALGHWTVSMSQRQSAAHLYSNENPNRGSSHTNTTAVTRQLWHGMPIPGHAIDAYLLCEDSSSLRTTDNGCSRMI